MRKLTAKPILGILVAIYIIITVSEASHAHVNHRFGTVFHQASLPEATEMAKAEHKLVFVFLCKPGIPPPFYLDRPTRDCWPIVDLVLRETIPIKLTQPNSADRIGYQKIGSLPLILLLDTNGTEQGRLNGNLSQQQLHDDILPFFSNAAALQRAVQAAQSNEYPSITKERLARSLVRCGDYAGALKEFNWLVTNGLQTDNLYASTRRRYLFEAFAALARYFPPARKALRSLQTKMEKEILAKDRANRARDLAELNRSLDDRGRTLSFYDRLSPRCKARHILFDKVLNQLVEARRYGEVLKVVDPVQAFQQEVRLAKRRDGTTITAPTGQLRRGTLQFAIARGAMFVEALAGTGRTTETRQLVDQILRLSNTPDTRKTLLRHVNRTGNHKLATYISQQARATTQPKADNSDN
ncbi:MAG: hypothetical protein K8S14_03855 [Actinomycetia bacterium]|nr:hypothetical protein [Actinomycetes bacterium]